MTGVDYAAAFDRGPVLEGDRLACLRGERFVFAGLSFRLEAGGALVLTGANGSGKSSLLRLLATLLTPVSGRLCWAGEPVAADPIVYRTQLHYVGHLDAIKPALTPCETLAFWSGLRGAYSARSVASALAAFGLDRIADWPCRWLSAGQRRRLGLARLIAAPAPVWLLDEPTAALDADSEARLVELILAHREAGGRVVLATHQPVAIGAAAALSLDGFAPAADLAADPSFLDEF